MIRYCGHKNSFIVGFVGSLVTVLAMFLAIKSYGIALLAAVFMVGVISTMPFVFLCIYIPQIFPTHLSGTASGISWSVGRIVAAIAGLSTGPIIAFFSGSYACAASCVSLIYIVGLAAAFFVKEPCPKLKASGEVAEQLC
jgi:nitrate/nitrite transporter NarK